MKKRSFDPEAHTNRIDALEQQLRAARAEIASLRESHRIAWTMAAWGGTRAPLKGERTKRDI